MSVRKLREDEFVYECDGCDSRQVGVLGKTVEGMVVDYTWHRKGGGETFQTFACTPYCQGKAFHNTIRGDWREVVKGNGA